MAYFTPTQEWIRELWTQNAQGGMPQGLAIAPQLPAPPMTARHAEPQLPPQVDEPEENPIAKGLNAGLNAGRKSVDIDERQRERLAGLMLFNMFSGLGNSAKNPNPTVLGSLSEGLKQGMPHIQDERAHIEKLNMLEMERQDALAKEMQRQKERQAEQRDLNSYRNSMLELQQQKIGGMGTNQQSAQLENAIPLRNMPKGAQTGALQEMRQTIASEHSLHDVLTTLDKMQQLSDENPHLGESFALAYFDKKDGKGLNKVLKNIALGKDREIVEEWSKLENFLIEKRIKSTKGPATDRLKRIYQDSTPTAGMTKKSIDYVIKAYRDETMPYYEHALRTKQGMMNGEYVMPNFPEYKSPFEKKAQSENNSSQPNDIESRLKSAREHEDKYTDEEIAKVMAE
jgi:hypothetical protein